MFESDIPVLLKDFSATFNLADNTPYMLIKRNEEIYKPIKNGQHTYIPANAVRHYRKGKKKLERTGRQVYSFYMRKGGVGKTSLLLNLASRSIMAGYKVLLIDMDSQANLTKACKVTDIKRRETFQEIFEELTTISDAKIKIKENLFLVPCNNKFSSLAQSINTMEGYNQFKPIIDKAKKEFDLIFIDNGGIMDMTIFQTLAASDHIISPAQPDEFSEEGLELTQSEIFKLYKQDIKPKHSIVMTFYREREKASREYLDMFTDLYGDTVSQVTIPKSQDFTNTLNNINAMSIYEHDYHSPVCNKINKLFFEIIESNNDTGDVNVQ